jgi:hypothetical protein
LRGNGKAGRGGNRLRNVAAMIGLPG